MRVNIELSSIQAADTIIVANNRQALAFKKSLANLDRTSRIPQVYAYQSLLEKFWKNSKSNQDKRLLTQLESRILLKKFCEEASVKNPETFIEELIKCHKLCKSYGLEINMFANFASIPTKLFVRIIKRYEKFKAQNNCIDQTDIFNLTLDYQKLLSKNNSQYFRYGFNEPTPEQNKLFKILKCKPLFAKKMDAVSKNLSFLDQESEIKAIASWAKITSIKHPEKQIGIVIPNLNELHHQVKSTFDMEFNSSLLETHKKPYNISLGISLSNYPLIMHLVAVLRLSNQFLNGSIETELLTEIITSPYIKGARSELNNRALLVNKILELSSARIKASDINSLCQECSILNEIFTALNNAKFAKKLTLEESLEAINSILLHWGFTSDRILSSSEYQVYEKYQIESLVLNKLSIFDKTNSLDVALEILVNHLNAVIFQPQSGPANIHILGSLEAEGLFFDFAWVSSMTSNFLPGKVTMPLFIPSKISIDYSLPGTSFELITKESRSTLNNLYHLSENLTFSYSTTFNSREQLPTPYLLFENPQVIHNHQMSFREMESVEDLNAPKIIDFEIKKGVKTLQDQLSCEFKGFSNRLNLKDINDPSIGISKIEQGNIIHKILEGFFNEIRTSSALKELSEAKLDELIEAHSESALNAISESNFKNNERIRLKRIVKQYLTLEKGRDFFEVIETESESQVNLSGLQFTTRIDRMDQLKDGSKLIIDYKTGKNVGLSKLISEPLEQAQLPIYAISNKVDGVAFANINSKDCQFKAITKNKYDLPMSNQSINRMPEWKKQVSQWSKELVNASQQFQNGNASVLPAKNACDYCEYDLLCRVDKADNNG